MGELINVMQAMQELQITEEELQDLVASGRLRPYRSGGETKFRFSDVHEIAGEQVSDAAGTVVMSADAVPEPMAPSYQEVDESAATVAPGVEAGGGFLDDSELDILPLDEDTAGAATEELTISEIEDTEGQPELVEAPEVEPPSARIAVSRRLQAAYDVQPGDPITAALLVVTTLILVFTFTVFAAMWKGPYDEMSGTKFVPGYLQGLYESFGGEGTGE